MDELSTKHYKTIQIVIKLTSRGHGIWISQILLYKRHWQTV